MASQHVSKQALCRELHKEVRTGYDIHGDMYGVDGISLGVSSMKDNE